MFGLTVSNNCDLACEMGQDGTSAEPVLKERYFREDTVKPVDIIYGDVGSLERDQLLTQFHTHEPTKMVIHEARLSKSKRCVVVDEVDGFFFQAEDGIRDVAVTGVQTCALPISTPGHAAARAAGGTGAITPSVRRPARLSRYLSWNSGKSTTTSTISATASSAKLDARSEERRVGKECRSRWSPYRLRTT